MADRASVAPKHGLRHCDGAGAVVGSDGPRKAAVVGAERRRYSARRSIPIGGSRTMRIREVLPIVLRRFGRHMVERGRDGPRPVTSARISKRSIVRSVRSLGRDDEFPTEDTSRGTTPRSSSRNHPCGAGFGSPICARHHRSTMFGSGRRTDGTSAAKGTRSKIVWRRGSRMGRDTYGFVVPCNAGGGPGDRGASGSGGERPGAEWAFGTAADRPPPCVASGATGRPSWCERAPGIARSLKAQLGKGGVVVGMDFGVGAASPRSRRARGADG